MTTPASGPSAGALPRRTPSDEPVPWRTLALFVPYLIVLVIHLVALAVGPATLVYPTKLALMPALAVGVSVASRGLARRARATIALLLLALAFSWLGDGAAWFFPFLADELPAMLACFGVAHVLYIVLFVRLARGARPRARLPRWTLVYVV